MIVLLQFSAPQQKEELQKSINAYWVYGQAAFWGVMHYNRTETVCYGRWWALWWSVGVWRTKGRTVDACWQKWSNSSPLVTTQWWALVWFIFDINSSSLGSYLDWLPEFENMPYIYLLDVVSYNVIISKLEKLSVMFAAFVSSISLMTLLIQHREW